MINGLYWTLVAGGRRIVLYENDPKTSFLSEKHVLYFVNPMSYEEALKFVEANFPEYTEEYPAMLAD
jgi:hypothetical protein